jgi:hypothetical protein
MNRPSQEGLDMKKYLAAVALAAALAQPAVAITFPSLTTIYVGTGVENSGSEPGVGTATVFQCVNVSGQQANLRLLLLKADGTLLGSSFTSVQHGQNLSVSTHATTYFEVDAIVGAGNVIVRGTINIESTQSAVFCQAWLVDAQPDAPSGLPLHLIRVNPHHGTVE